MTTLPAPGPALRPLGVGEVLDVALKICVRHWKPLVAITLIATIPATVFALAIVLSVIPDEGGLTDKDTATLGAAFVVVGLVYLILQLVMIAASLKAVTDGYLGGQPSWRSSFAFAFRRTHSLLWISLLGFLILLLPIFVIGTVIAAVGGLGALLVPPALVLMTWVFIRLLSTVPALLAEDVRGTKALRRSWKLTEGNWWRTFGAYLVAIFFLTFVSAIVGNLLPAAIAAPVGNPIVAGAVLVIFGVVSSAITTPFLAAVIAVIYFDLRVRNEGLDLELLAQRIGTERDPAAPLIAPAAGAYVGGVPGPAPPPPGSSPPPPGPGSSPGPAPPPPPGAPPPPAPE